MKKTYGLYTFVLTIFAVTAIQSNLFAEHSILSIGTADNDTGEFQFAPDQFEQFSEDPVFVQGRSQEDEWPYVHPGPADDWAGSSPHTFSVLFGLEGTLKKNDSIRLIIDCVDVHDQKPSTLDISLNGQQVSRRKLPAGKSGESVRGDLSDAKEHFLTVELPGERLRKQMNWLQIQNVSGSWFLYDQVKLIGPDRISGSAPEDSGILSANVEAIGPRIDGKPAQYASVNIFRRIEDPVRLRVNGKVHSVSSPDVITTVRIPLPPADRRKTISVHLLNRHRVVDRIQLTRPPGRRLTPADHVDPLAGTANSRWMLFPGPTRPFGMVKMSPNTKPGVVDSDDFMDAGYQYRAEQIIGFDHIHSWGLGGLLTMPTTGPLRVKNTEYGSSFSHKSETASTGYYAVTLEDYDIRAELTSTKRTSFQRYTFPETDDARILLDLLPPAEYSYRIKDASVRRVNETEIEGYIDAHVDEMYDQPNTYKLHFVAKTNKPFDTFGGWNQEGFQKNVERITGRGDGVSPVGGFVEFSTEKNEVVKLKIGVSFVSLASARNNLKKEASRFGWDFDACRRASWNRWNELLQRIDVTATPSTLETFYTNLYRSYSGRTVMSDVNGKYRDMYENVKQSDTPIYGSDAFWNTFWNLNQLWTLATPSYMEQWVKSLLTIYEDGGWLPAGPAGIEYTRVMVASHAIPMIVGAYQHGITGFDAEQAFRAMDHQQTTPGKQHSSGGAVGNKDLEAYMQYGYVPVDKGLVSNTAEYAYDDWCVAQFAKSLGRNKRYEYYRKRSQNWKNSFDPETKFLRPRHSNGNWLDFTPEKQRRGRYAEGNAAQYTWFVPHDVRGLVQKMGRDTFVNRLNQYFEEAKSSNFQGRNFGVNHGNQPSMQVAYLFNYAGAPWLTQKWARGIMNRYYGTGPQDAYPGQEDQGQMGAWYVMSALGLFQVDGGCRENPIYQIGSPVVDRASIQLDGNYYSGDEFIVVTHNNNDRNQYIQSASLDGKPLNKPYVRAADVLDGGKLVLEMGPRPNKNWGSDPDDLPPSAIDEP